MKKYSKDFGNKEFLLNYVNRRWGGKRILAFDFSLTHHYNPLKRYLSNITGKEYLYLYHECKKRYYREENE